MKKLLFALVAGSLVISGVALQAGEKLYRIRLVSTDGDVFGQPVAFQEVAQAPSPTPLYVPTPAPQGVPTPAPQPGSPSLQPVPEPYTETIPSPGVAPFQTVELYPRVKYEDLDNVHPLAVKKIVAVKDPRWKRSICGTCAPPCVYVMICVPPCDKFKFDVKRKDHSKVEYDYGEYEIEITSKNGVVYVDYDD